jgi:hypothetical protein
MSTPLQEQLAARGISAEALSDLGLDPERAIQLLSGSDPTIDEVRTIAKSFRIPVRQLITRVALPSGGKLKLRENFRAVIKEEGHAEAFDLLSRAQFFSQILPDRNEQRIRVDLPLAERDFEAAERLSGFCRASVFGSDESEPLINLEELVAAHTSLYVLVMNLRRTEGSVILLGGRSFAFLAERNDPRMRFTLAHELCHFLIDFDDIDDGGWFDQDIMRASAEEYRRSEQFANTFAAALLLPAGAVGTALAEFRKAHRIEGDQVSDVEIAFLGRFFGVNFQVAGRRCEDLKLIPKGAGEALYSAVRRQYGSPELMADEVGLPPRPFYRWGLGQEIVLREAEAALITGGISIGRLAEALELSPDRVAQRLSE